jgi:density-regulated protein DRP1
MDKSINSCITLLHGAINSFLSNTVCAKRSEEEIDIIMTDILTTPVAVIYCGACGMPPEYCSYGPDYESHCVPWLKSSHPDIYARLRAIAGGGGGGAAESSSSTDANAPTTAAVPAPAAPAGPWTTRQRLVAFYDKYMPEKLDGIDSILEKYQGKEDKLFVALVKKYGPEPDDPYYADGSDSDDDDDDDDGDDVGGKMRDLDVGDGTKKKRRGAAAKRVNKVDTRVIIQKISRNRKKAVTHVVGLDTVPNMKLKDAAKAFSKRFAGSSSVKDKEIIIQGDHVEDVADMIVSKFGVKEDAVFFDLDGEFVPYGG